MPTFLNLCPKKQILLLNSQAHKKMINLKWVQQAFTMYDRLKYSDKHVEANGSWDP